MRKLKLYKRAKKFVDKLPPKQKRQVVGKAAGLTVDVQPADSKKLIDSDRFRVDIGEYRIVYWWDDALVHVVLIGKRNDSDVYRQLQRLERG